MLLPARHRRITRRHPFFLNTSDSAAWGRFELEAMAFHEGVPEHHLQGSIADELPASGQDADDGDQQEQLEARKVDAVGGGAWVARGRVWLRDRAIDS